MKGRGLGRVGLVVGEGRESIDGGEVSTWMSFMRLAEIGWMVARMHESGAVWRMGWEDGR